MDLKRFPPSFMTRLMHVGTTTAIHAMWMSPKRAIASAMSVATCMSHQQISLRRTTRSIRIPFG